MDDVKRTLIEAKALIEKGFCTGAYAKDKDGHSIGFADDKAVCFCSQGAIRRVVPEYNHKLLEKAIKWLARFMGNSGVVAFNDNHTQEEVLERFNRAIVARDTEVV